MLATCPPLWALWACRPSTRTLGAHRKSKATHFAAKVLEPANSTLQDRIIRAHASIWAPLPDTRLALPLSLPLLLPPPLPFPLSPSLSLSLPLSPSLSLLFISL